MHRVLKAVLLAAVVWILAVSPALAHVTIQPNEAMGQSFSHFVVSVPNERDNASTTRVEVRFPALGFVGFEDVPGWERTVRMRTLDEPIESFGEELDEVVGTVTWSGGSVGPSEFIEFPFSAAMPPGEEELEFAAIQTYDNGEVVRWIGPEDSEEPAPLVHTVELGELGEGVGQLGALHEAVHEIEELQAEVEDLSAQVGEDGEEPSAATESDEDESDSDMGVILGGIGVGIGTIALILALMKKRA